MTKELQNNLQRIQMIYSCILNEICTWSARERTIIRTRESQIYLLAENNQWKLPNNLYIYMDDNGTNNSFNDTVPCLTLDFKNKHHENL